MATYQHDKEFLNSLEDIARDLLVGIREVVDLLQRVFSRSMGPFSPHSSCFMDECIALKRLWSNALKHEKSIGELLGTTIGDSVCDEHEEVLLAGTIEKLLTGLKLVYQVLDQVVEAKKETSNQRPKAPIGLLSLRHYTDICALVEFSICWSVLPLPGVLLPIHDRLHCTLPKTIAGRMPREALVWAADNASTFLLWISVGQLLLLDRFRSVLLPRHLTDLYAVILLRGFENEHDQDVKSLARELGVYGTSGLVNAVFQARTYQQLLRFGTLAPIGLRQQVSRLLAQASVRDLAAIVAVFVDDDGASAVRLARALIESLKTDTDRDSMTLEMLRCLDEINLSNEDPSQVPRQTLFMVQTIWAVADGFSDGRFFSALTTERLETDTKRLMCRLYSLWMFHPPQSPLPLHIMLRRNNSTCLNVVQVLTRILAAEAVLVSEVKARSKQVLKAMLLTTDNPDSLVLGLIQAVSPDIFDESWILRLQGDDLKMERNSDTDVTGIATGIERRSQALCEVLAESTAPIPPFLFRTLLNMYISTPEWSMPHFELVPMILLPLVCEKIETEKLVDEDDAILRMLQILLLRVVQQIGLEANVQKEMSNINDFEMEEARLQKAIDNFTEISKIQLGRLSPSSKLSTSADFEMLLETTTISLALFSSMLELGLLMQKEEEMQLITALLGCIAGITPFENRQDGAQTEELSEMASHAFALINSRSADSNERFQTTCETTIAEASKDLLSSDPPMRARSIAHLRNLANGSRVIDDKNDQSESSRLLNEIYHLSIQALSDKESYVFLAAIHTIVVVTEKWPARFIPLLGLTHLTGDCSGEMLCNDQRLKLGEALAHIVHKRVGVLKELPSLFYLYVIGQKQANEAEYKLSASQRLIAHNTTNSFFQNSNDDPANEMLKEREIRCRTGGPLFAVEEDCLVLSDRIYVVAELVAVLATSIIADVCGALVDCAIENLVLECERPLRRAGASLSYELYHALNRDEELRLATALAGSRHDVLVASLTRVVLDTEMQQRLQDPATIARCRDTLQVLEERTQHLILGRVAFEGKRGLEQNPIARMLAHTSTIDVASSLDYDTLL